ncbi:MAG: NAD(P) transhydrogenase subunit alpha [bacterium]|nr:NAD(P) transhydrogenase subunit alpha [bacterium]
MAQIGIRRELDPLEHRVAVVPQSINVLTESGWAVVIESGAGDDAGFPDEQYLDAGATVGDAAAIAACNIILGVGAPTPDCVAGLARGTIVVGFLDPYVDRSLMDACARAGITAVAVEAIPRTTLAQAMDALSSQTNIAGYAAVLMAAQDAPKLMPMMVTAAGTIAPARALILGVGVAGLQAIATAKRLGAIVHAYDIRPETAEQVESLGAKFVAAPTAGADEGGYAVEVEADTQAQQHAALAPHVAESDMIVTTAQIPGRPAPRLITAEMVAAMHPGSVIIDMAAGTGGNCELSRPDAVITVDGVRIHGPTNLAAQVPGDASRMYSRNLVALLTRMHDEGQENMATDAIFSEAAVILDGEVRHPRTRSLLGLEEA